MSKKAANPGIPDFQDLLLRGAVSEPRGRRHESQPQSRGTPDDMDRSLSLLSALNDAVDLQFRNSRPNNMGAREERREHQNKSFPNNAAVKPSEQRNSSQGRQHTPSTVPRTKFTAATPLEHKLAINKLRQRLQFEDSSKQENTSDVDQGRNDGLLSLNRISAQNDILSVSSYADSAQASAKESELSDMVDTGKIIERLEQVKEYLKQATAMYVNMSTSDATHASKAGQLEKLAQLIQQLRLQEQGYIDLLKRTMLAEQESLYDADSIISKQSEDANDDTEGGDNDPQQENETENELQALREQRDLLAMIAEQGRQLKGLKDRHSALLSLQGKAQAFIDDASQEDHDGVPYEEENAMVMEVGQVEQGGAHALPSDVNMTKVHETLLKQADAQQKRLELETKLEALQEKKQQMDQLLATLQTLRASQTPSIDVTSNATEESQSQVSSQMDNGQDDDTEQNDTTSNRTVDEEQFRLMSELMSSLGANLHSVQPTSHKADVSLKSSDSRHSLLKEREALQEQKRQLEILEQQRQMLSKLKQEQDELHLLQRQQEQRETVTAQKQQQLPHRPVVPDRRQQQPVYAGGARPREPRRSSNTSADNRSRTTPEAANNGGVNVEKSRNMHRGSVPLPVVPSSSQFNLDNLLSLADSNDLLSKIEDLQQARDRLVKMQQDSTAPPTHNQLSSASDVSSVQSQASSVSDSASEADASMVWQNDPEFHAKVTKLQLAKERLRHLQELVKVAQQGPGPVLPVDDLADLTMSEDDEDDSVLAAGQSDTIAHHDSRGAECDDAATATSCSEMETTVDEATGDHDFKYQAKLFQQKTELEQLLHEKEKLLNLKRQLTVERSRASVQTQTSIGLSDSDSRVSDRHVKDKYRAKGSRQESARQQRRDPPLRSYESGSQDGNSSGRVARVRLQSNPMALSELRRQRVLLEARKKQKFAERLQQIDEANHTNDYTLPSDVDVDEGVVVGATSIDNTTATWGGSSLQSNSSDEDDSAVGDEEEELPENDMDYDCYGQVEEEEEEAGNTLNEDTIPSPVYQGTVPPLFHVKATNLQGIRKIKQWAPAEDHTGKKRKRAKLADARKDELDSRGSVSVSSKPPSSTSLGFGRRQGRTSGSGKVAFGKRLTKTHLERHDWEQQCEQMYQQLTNSTALSTALLRNQQTLVAMIQNQGIVNYLQPTGVSLPYANVPSSASRPATHLRPDTSIHKLTNHIQSHKIADRAGNMVSAMEELTAQMRQQQEDVAVLEDLVRDLNRDSGARMPLIPGFNVGASGNMSAPASSNVPFAAPSAAPVGNASGMSGAWLPPPAPGPVPFHQTSVPSGANQCSMASSLFQQSDHAYTNEYALFGKRSNDEPPSKQRISSQEPPRTIDNTFSPFQVYETGLFNNQMPSQASERQPSEQQHVDGPLQSTAIYRCNSSGFYDSAIAAVSSSQQDNAASWSVVTPSKSVAASDLASKTKRAHSPPRDSAIALTAVTMVGDGKRAVVSRTIDADCDVVSMPDEEHYDSLAKTPSNFSLFEALRESIYSEVATLISMNEAKPHFLIELFRELQLLTSDYLRQRALYSLQDLVTRYLTEDAEHRETVTADVRDEDGDWTGASCSEHTPSESVMTSDDEEEQRMLRSLVGDNRCDDVYDYAEMAEITSSVSTPVSGADHPFATDGLGETVINLEEAMQQMRRYDKEVAETQRALERMSMKAKNATAQMNSNGAQGSQGNDPGASHVNDETSSNSTYDVASELSSDTQPASADVRRLDGQIKWIMKELIPFLNERMDDVCTVDLLSQIRHVVIVLAKQKEPNADKEEFGRSFHGQLESILRDTLSKFSGKRLKECGQEILIDVSEILFNELAFFRLMEDLDKPSTRGQSRELSQMKKIAAAVSSAVKNETQAAASFPIATFLDSDTTQDADSDAPSSDHLSDDYVKIDGFVRHPSAAMAAARAASESEQQGVAMQSELDEATASTASRHRPSETGSDRDAQTESSHQFVDVQLAASESRPIASTGSGEEDVEEDRASSATLRASSGQSASAVSHRRDHSSDSETESQDDRSTMPESDENRPILLVQAASPASSRLHVVNSPASADGDAVVNCQEDDREEHGQHADEDEATRNANNNNLDEDTDDIDSPASPENDDGNEIGQDERSEDVQYGDERQMMGACATEAEASMVNTADDAESEEVTIDDLPTKLTGLTEADLQTRMASEERANEGADAILSYLNGEPELAGDDDSGAARTPDESMNGEP